ncbi:MAG TPA: hypothetical protein VGF56_13015 [Rhizomicrobium sp.]
MGAILSSAPFIFPLFAVLLAGSWLLSRHVGLALLVTLPCLAAVALPGFAGGILPGYLIANVLALNASRGEARAPLIWPAACALIFVVVPVALINWRIGALIAGVGLMSGAFVMLGASVMPRGEGFIAASNRARESWQRLFDRLALLAQTRWGWSLSGVAAVLAALGWFGLRLHLRPIEVGVVAIQLALFFVVTRDWRRGLAAIFACVPLALFAVWIAAPARDSQFLWPLVLVLGTTMIALQSGTASVFLRRGDDMATASVRALERIGPALVLVTAIAAALFAVLAPAHVATPLAMLAMGAGVLLFEPAFAGAIENVFPRKAAIEARYRLG